MLTTESEDSWIPARELRKRKQKANMEIEKCVIQKFCTEVFSFRAGLVEPEEPRLSLLEQKLVALQEAEKQVNKGVYDTERK